MLWFRFLNIHGDLPTPYLHEYSTLNRAGDDYQSTYKRLKKLYNHGWVLRDPQQYKSALRPDSSYCVYRLSKKSKKFLQDRGAFIENTPKPSGDNWKHDFLRACCSASKHLYCLRHPELFEYIPHHRIVDRIGKDRFDVEGDIFFPDLLDGIKYVDTGTVRLTINEIDCNTEQLESTPTSIKNRKKTFEDKIVVAKKYIGSGLYKQDFGISGGLLLSIITTNATHMQNLIDIALKVKPYGFNYMLFQYVDGFGDFIKPPKDIFPLIENPWYCAGKEPFNLAVA